MKRAGKLLAILGALACLSGCGTPIPEASTPYNGTGTDCVVEADDYYILRGENTMVVEKATGKKYPLVNDPLEAETAPITPGNFKTCGNVVYFLWSDEAYTPIVYSLDLDTGERRTLFTDREKGREIQLFDVTIWKEKIPLHHYGSDSLKDFFLLEGQLVLIRGDAITRYDGRRETPLYEGKTDDVTTDGRRVFFTDEKGVLCRLDTAGELTRFPDCRPVQPAVVGDKAYFLDPYAGNSFAAFDLESQEQRTVLPGEWKSFTTDGEGFLLTDKTGAAFYAHPDGTDYYRVASPDAFDEAVLLDGGENIAFISYDPSASSPVQILPNSPWNGERFHLGHNSGRNKK